MRRGFAAKRDFRTIHAIYARLSTGRATCGYDDVAGDETEFHEPARDVFGKVQTIECAWFAFSELRKSLGVQSAIWRNGLLVDTQLHRGISIRRHSQARQGPPVRRGELLNSLYPTILVLDAESVKKFFAAVLDSN